MSQHRNRRITRRSPRPLTFRPRLEALEPRALPTAYVVTTAADSGIGSLREAILDANSHPGEDTITFAIGSGVQTIHLLSALPAVLPAVTIDGTTQGGFAGTPLIVLDGSAAGTFANGLTLTGGNSTVRGLVLNRFGRTAIVLEGQGGDMVVGNFLGTDPTGTRIEGNGNNHAVDANTSGNRIGGLTAADRNLVSGNQAGINVSGTGNVVEGNYVGTDLTGTHRIANGTGIAIGGNGNTVGGTVAAARNVVAGNTDGGINLSGSNNVVEGNYVGTDVTGTVAIANGRGVYLISAPTLGIFCRNNVIGGTTAAARNLISGNGSGVEMDYEGTTGNVVEGNYIGTDPTGTTALANGNGVYLYQAVANTIGGPTLGARNLISGNGAGVHIFNISTGNAVEGNYIGTDPTGTRAVPNGTGVFVDPANDSSNNTIGGDVAGTGNLISGNTNAGVSLSGGNNRVQGNLIGTDATGTVALGNGTGVTAVGSGHLIGGVTAEARNVISGNRGVGVLLQGRGVLVEGNYVGTDATGRSALGNLTGVAFGASATADIVGGTAAGAGNVVSGNVNYGVAASDPTIGTGNAIQGNLIGTNAAGTAALRNVYGVYLAGVSGITVGGAAGNLISGNLTGVYLIATSTITVQGNRVGTNADGTAAVANAEGVFVFGGSGNSVVENLVSGNTNYGVAVASDGNTLRGNRVGLDASGTRAVGNATGVYVGGANNALTGGNVISGNTRAGIELAGPGATGTVVTGNYVGTDLGGTRAVGNLDGILLGGSGNVVGGRTPAERNVVSGNVGSGIVVNAGGNRVEGNYVGTDPTGGSSVPNGAGVAVNGSIGVTVGGTASGAGNLISGNTGAGVFITGNGNWVEGNFVGTDAAGTRAVANGTGVSVRGTDNVVGGTAPGAGNLISGNGTGVGLTQSDTSNNRVEGNLIGVDVTGGRALGNGTGVSVFYASNNTVGGTAPGAGNVISGNRTDGVHVEGILSAYGNVIAGNLIGTDAAGTRALGNGTGVSLVNAGGTLVGGTAPEARNVISGNQTGVYSANDGGTTVWGDYIGTDITGSLALGNGTGVHVQYVQSYFRLGGTDAGAGNVVSGNTGDGVFVEGGTSSSIRASVQGNTIGLDATGTRPIRNGRGVHLETLPTQVGGTGPGAGNVISGNTGEGIYIGSGSGAGSDHVIQGNLIGTDATGTAAIGNRAGVVAGGFGNTVGGTAPGSANLISGNAGDGITLTANGNRVQGNLIGTDITGTHALGNRQGVTVSGANNVVGGTAAGAGNLISGNTFGVFFSVGGASGNVVAGNWIGVDATGEAALGNFAAGVYVASRGNTVGGLAGAGNVIAGNGDGIYLSDVVSSNTTIQGNRIGTDATGTIALGNGTGSNGDGIVISNTSAGNTIGGTAPGAGNLISGNRVFGISVGVGGNNVIQGNWIGIDASGGVALGNGMDGIFVGGSPNNLIGGTAPGAGNVVSGNGGFGIQIVGAGATGTRVQGNLIGTDATGIVALGNRGGGVEVFSANNTIGGTAPGAGNLISGNGGDGVLLAFTGTVVQGNRIGTDATGTADLGNAGNGVTVRGSGDTVGGIFPGAANVIAFNGGDGVLVDGGTGDAILHNAIFANVGLGIELLHGGNHNQAPPALLTATSDGSTLTLQGTFAGVPGATYTIELFANSVCDPSGAGQGERFLGSFTVTVGADGSASFTVSLAASVEPGEFLSATATDPGQNTSAFSQCLVVASAA